jgi:hypothetical protein
MAVHELLELLEVVPFTDFRDDLTEHVNDTRSSHAEKPLGITRHRKLVSVVFGVDRNGNLIISPKMYSFLEKMMKRTISE